jgi:hypothetical protein
MDNGKIDKLLTQGLKQVIQDCVDRPTDKKPRKVTLQLDFVPIPDDLGTCDEVSMSVQSKVTVPVKRTKTYSVGAKPSGEGFLNLASDDNVNQSTLDDMNG